ncbi:DUF998 domain-containing protein [Leifsonia shinshuensis]|uniref:DUF998 domain-containing protein n=1 Tax=Leifsonia shinshuensis TaxID=150026 RepID=UPI001F50BE2A|nr:DUF998 domain-containing protein [Leifsonia shinshuensis]MCI0159353.1 DUF998 domain-containing protein [Leifsonia shinshuensis]
MNTAVSADSVGEHRADRLSRRLQVASVESLALGMGALAFVAVGVVAFFVFAGHDLSIAGTGSVGQFAAIACCIVALVAYGSGRITTWSIPWFSRPKEHRSRLGAAVEVFDSLAISVAHAVVVLLLWTVLSDVLARSFQDAQVFALPATLLVGTAAAVSAYYVFLSAANMNPLLLSAVLAIFLVVGALTSMLTASNPHWWKQNLSVLGISDDLSAATFNITVIVGGVLVTAIARYATDSGSLERRPTRGELQVRTGLIVVGAMLACVGLFPVDRFFLLHNTAATGMAVVFCILAIGIRWMMPHLPRAFYVLGWVFIGVIVLVALFFAVGYYNLTAVELVAAVLIFSWIIVFLRIAEAAGSDRRRAPWPGQAP